MNQLKAGAILSYILIILNNVIGLLYTPFMLRMMGTNEYGLYSLAASVVAYLTVLDLGFANSIIRYTAKFRAENKQKEQEEMFGMFFILYCGISLLTLIVGIGIYFHVDSLFGEKMTMADMHKIRIMLLLLIFNLAFTFPMSIWGSIITAYEKFVFQKLVNIIRVILNPIVMILLLLIGYKAIAMVVVITLFNVITLCINAWYCRKKLHIRIRFARFKWCFFQEIMIYSFFIFLNAIMDRAYWSFGQLILGMYVGTLAVAVYAVAIQLISLFMNFSTAISGVFLPKITFLVSSKGNEENVSQLFIRIGRIQFMVMGLILTGFLLFGKQFIALWAGDNYMDAYPIASILFIALLFPLTQNLGLTILQARNQLKFCSILYLLEALCCVAFSLLLVRRYGGLGCAISTATVLILGQVVVLNIYYYKKVQIDIPKYWSEILKLAFIPLLLGVVFYFILSYFVIQGLYSLGILIGCFTLLYIVLIYFIGMNDYERTLLLKTLSRKKHSNIEF